MTLTGEIKILDDKVWFGEKAAKISAFSSKNLLEKYEYLTGEDLGHRPSVLEKLNLIILHWVCHLGNHFKQIMLKVLRIKRAISVMMVDINFTDFTSSMMNLKRCH